MTLLVHIHYRQAQIICTSNFARSATALSIAYACSPALGSSGQRYNKLSPLFPLVKCGTWQLSFQK